MDDNLADLVSRWGVELSYLDVQGHRQAADPEAVRRIVAALAAAAAPARVEVLQRGVIQAYQGDNSTRHWLLAVQLYAVRSATNWGHGDFTDLAALVGLAAEIGAAGIGLNPLHALFPDRAEDASPYSPNSRLFLNPLYIDVTAAPGFSTDWTYRLAGELTRLRAAPCVDYTGVAKIKLQALRSSYDQFRQRPDGADDFAAFREERGKALERFAAFETLRTNFSTCWWEWPDEWRRPTGQALQSLRHSQPEEVGFHEYLQWVADRQLTSCQQLARKCGCAIGLYIDLAVGVHPNGADAWSEQDSMLGSLSIGAPPDPLNTAGQDWGLTTYNPHSLAALGFKPWHDLLAAAMRYAGAVRLDHILGLNRMFVVPHGLSARQGAYVRFPLDMMLQVVAEESGRHRCIVIGEDLGTVPEGFRQKLAQYGIWTYRVMLFEREHDGGFRPPEHYPAHALATFATHDMATLAGWSTGGDLAVKRAIDLDPGETDEERNRARDAFHAAVARFRNDDNDLVAVARFLANTPSRLVAVAIEDVLRVTDQINVPGTVHQHPNWRRRLPATLEQIRTDDCLLRVAAAFAQAGRRN